MKSPGTVSPMTSPARLSVIRDEADPLDPAPPVELVAVPRAVARPTAALFGGLSRLRGKRAMHPAGVVLRATLQVPSSPSLPAEWRRLDGAEGIVRFSKSVGTPGAAPDVLGLALRFGDQDVLVASSLRPPVLQHALIPAKRFDAVTFSSLLPFRVGGRLEVIQVRLSTPLPAADDQLDSVRDAGVITIELETVGLFGGRHSLGVVTTAGVIDSDRAARVRFDPWCAGGGLTPAGPLQRIRAAAYAASRRATRR